MNGRGSSSLGRLKAVALVTGVAAEVEENPVDLSFRSICSSLILLVCSRLWVESVDYQKNFDEVKAIYGVDKEGSNNHHPYDLGAYENFKTVSILSCQIDTECFRSVPVTTAIVSNPLDRFNKVAATLMMTDLPVYELMDLKYLHFLASQFADQEPGSKEETKEVVCAMFKAEFPIFDKHLDNMLLSYSQLYQVLIEDLILSS
ncbi:hypothetical protein J5N97_009694 [Dioscorea zingiberensis]|uniref:Uncharacterized protein n=1 Tax=Dioscorea zingiberensis TaxID=325984 RepID=A0A9D5HLW9_9LILI|nr:hypothetical protein J5N97_009694 [Dioscorea zingiberensis]